MGARRRGGGQEGAIKKYRDPHNDNLTRKIKKKNNLVSEETDMRGPSIVSKETNLRGSPYSMRSNLSKGAPT